MQFTAGLEEKIKTDGLSSLVYRYTFCSFSNLNLNGICRVHPLPESLVDYVWDYGALEAVEERLYIRSIVANSVAPNNHHYIVDMFADLIAESQECIFYP
jgi:hypothetical protein